MIARYSVMTYKFTGFGKYEKLRFRPLVRDATRRILKYDFSDSWKFGSELRIK